MTRVTPKAPTEDRKVILTRSRGRQFERQFFLQIQESILDGYRIAETELLADESLRMFQGNSGRCVMYKEGTAPDKWVPAVVEAPDEAVEAPEEAVEAPEETPEGITEVPDTIVKEETPEVSTGVVENLPLTPSEELATLSKTIELREFASKHGIAIPDDKVVPSAIKKHLKEYLAEAFTVPSDLVLPEKVISEVPSDNSLEA